MSKLISIDEHSPLCKNCWCFHTQSMPLCPNSPTFRYSLVVFIRKIRPWSSRWHWWTHLALPRKKTLVPIVGKNEKQASPYLLWYCFKNHLLTMMMTRQWWWAGSIYNRKVLCVCHEKVTKFFFLYQIIFSRKKMFV